MARARASEKANVAETSAAPRKTKVAKGQATRKRATSSSGNSAESSEANTSGASLLVIDAGLAAGWRRADPDLDQLDAVVEAAIAIVPDVVVMADASLKWSLPDSQQERFEEYRATSRVLCAPGGTKGGHHAFLRAAAELAAGKGRDVWLLSGLDLGEGPWRRAMLRRPDGVWRIETT